MARGVYSDILFQYAGVAPGPGYTVATLEGFVMVVRDIDCYSTVIGNTLIFEGLLVGETWNRFDVATESPAKYIYSWRGRQVFVYGDGFKVVSTEGDWDVRISGYLLTV